MQFRINKHDQIFQRPQKIARPRRASAICSLWKIFECLFILNCTRKFIWLLVNNIQVTISVTLHHLTWHMEATSYLFWHVNSRVNIYFLRAMYENWAVSFNCESSLYPQLNTEELDHKAKEKLTSQRIRCGFLAKCLSSGWETVSRVWGREETIQLSTSCLNQNTEKRS